MRGAALERDGMCRRLRADKNGRRALGSSRWWLRTYAANGSRPALGVFERAIKREGLKVSARTVERELARRVSVHEGWRSGPHAVLGQEPGGRRLSERSLDPAHRPTATGALVEIRPENVTQKPCPTVAWWGSGVARGVVAAEGGKAELIPRRPALLAEDDVRLQRSKNARPLAGALGAAAAQEVVGDEPKTVLHFAPRAPGTTGPSANRWCFRHSKTMRSMFRPKESRRASFVLRARGHEPVDRRKRAKQSVH